MTLPQTFQQRVALAMRAGEGAIVVPTHEQQACISALYEASEEVARAKGGAKHRPTVRVWSAASGTRRVEENDVQVAVAANHDHNDALVDIRSGDHPPTIFVLADFDAYLRDAYLARLALETVWSARSRGHLVVFMQRKPELPAKTLMDEVSVIEHRLPDRDALESIATSLMRQHAGIERLGERDIDNLRGLSSVKAASAVATGMIEALDAKQAAINTDTLRRYKEQEIGKRPYLRVIEPTRSLQDLIGHDALKNWISRRALGFTKKAREAGLPPPKGMLLGGPPGTGKTVFAEAIGHTLGIPLLLFDVGAAYQSHLGESEENVREAIEIAEVMSPCILMLDEVERMFPDGGGDKDGGTSQRILGKFLTWMSQKTAPVFVIMTSNHPDRLPAALIRKGRLDELFAVDLPTLKERIGIWTHYLNKAGISLESEGLGNNTPIEDLADASKDYSGAEIESIVESARFAAFAEDRAVTQLDLERERESTIPVAESMSDKVTAMREWAKKNARSTQSVRDDESNSRGGKPYAGSSLKTRRVS